MTDVDFHQGGDAELSGTFGVIDPRFYGEPHWTQHPARPSPKIISRNDPGLGKFIAEMVDGTQAGYGRVATPSLNTDWSKVVEKLLHITYNRALTNRSTLGSARPPRGVHAFVCYGQNAIPFTNAMAAQPLGCAPPFREIIPYKSA